MTARERIIPVFVPHLGCSNDCVFCNQRRISGKQNPAKAEDVQQAVEEGLLKTGTTDVQLAFYGGSFTAIPIEEQEELLGAAKEFLDRKRISSIRLSTRPDAIDGTVLNRLRKYGVGTIEIGAQSLDDEVLRLAGRGHTAEDVEKASVMIKQAGFRLILQMMTGLPGDSPERDCATAEKIIRLKPDGVRIYPTVIVKDTALYDLWKAGRYPEHTVEDAVDTCSVLLPMFQRAGIPVIRLGLNPTEELSSGAAAGGAYHPALGELVKSRILRKKAEKLLDACGTDLTDASVCIGVSGNRLSQMTGQHRCNTEFLTGKYALKSLRFVRMDAETQQNEEIRLISIEKG